MHEPRRSYEAARLSDRLPKSNLAGPSDKRLPAIGRRLRSPAGLQCPCPIGKVWMGGSPYQHGKTDGQVIVLARVINNATLTQLNLEHHQLLIGLHGNRTMQDAQLVVAHRHMQKIQKARTTDCVDG